MQAFSPALHRTSPTLQRSSIVMLDSPLEALAAPLRKFEAAPTVPSGSQTAAAAAANSNILSDLPLEVSLLFGFLVVVGIFGLVRSATSLGDNAPTIGIGESRDELAEKAAAAKEELENMSQSEKEKKYFGEIAGQLAEKRGGSKTKRKKKSKKK